MSPDMKELLQAGTAPGGEPDVAKISERARRYGWRRRAVIAGATACIGLGALGTYSLAQNTAPGPNIVVAPPEQDDIEIPIEQRAATVAIAAVHGAGLADPEGTYFDYRQISSVGQDRWEVAFCNEQAGDESCGVGYASTSVTVERRGEELVVTNVGGAFSEDPDRFLGYSESVNDPRIGEVFTGFVSADGQKGGGITTATYWRGPIPSHLAADCEIKGALSSGVTWSRELPVRSPSVEGARDGVLEIEAPPGADPKSTEVVCGEYREEPEPKRPGLPEGPGTVVAQGESSGTEGDEVQWELLAWDQPDGWCWGFGLIGEEQPQMTCVPASTETDIPLRGWGTHEMGAGPDVMAHGEVRADVETVALHLRSGEMTVVTTLRPPSELDIPMRYFVAQLPSAEIEMVVAFNGEGQEIYSREVPAR